MSDHPQNPVTDAGGSTDGEGHQDTGATLEEARKILREAERGLFDVLRRTTHDDQWQGVAETLVLASVLDELRRMPGPHLRLELSSRIFPQLSTVARSTSAGGDNSADHGDGGDGGDDDGEGMLPGRGPGILRKLLAVAREHGHTVALMLPPGRHGSNPRDPQHSRPSGMKSDGDNTADDGSAGRGKAGESWDDPQQKSTDGIEGG